MKRFVELHENLPGTPPREVLVNLDHVRFIVANHFFDGRTGSLLSFGDEDDFMVVVESFEEIRKHFP